MVCDGMKDGVFEGTMVFWLEDTIWYKNINNEAGRAIYKYIFKI